MIDLLLTILIGSFFASVILASYRFLKGPTIPDRLLALDIITYSLVVIIAIVAVMLGSPYLIVVSFSLSLWFFIGSLYVARYLEGKYIGD